jgi:hypothetical protein
VYPNPANDMINIELTGMNAMQASVSLYNLCGQKIMQNTNLLKDRPVAQMNLSGMDAGIYILEIETSMGKIVKRIVKH